MGYLKWIKKHVWQIDKLLHALVGLVVFLLWDKHINLPMGWESGVAMIPVFLAGAGKEIYDELKVKNSGDPWDFFATLFFALIYFLITLL